MDIAKLSMSMSQTKTATSASLLMMKKVLDQTEQTGEQLVQMIEQTAVAPGKVDIQA